MPALILDCILLVETLLGTHQDLGNEGGEVESREEELDGDLGLVGYVAGSSI